MKLQVCPNCKKPSLKYDSIFDFWQCQSCNHLYSDGLDDPDYDDDVLQAQEAIAERNIELINQWKP